MTDRELELEVARAKRQRAALLERRESPAVPEVEPAWLERELEDRRNGTASVEMDERPGRFY
jgi:hypothetical protein